MTVADLQCILDSILAVRAMRLVDAETKSREEVSRAELDGTVEREGRHGGSNQRWPRFG